jgi:hypothetical protein
LADEIRIENVGGDNGLASEVTLLRLVETMEKMASAAGKDPKSQAAKAEKARTDSIRQGIKVSTKHRDAVKDNTDAVKKNTKYLKMMGAGFLRLGALLTGAAFESISNFGKELLGTSRELSTFAQHLPILGGHISFLTGLFDESFNTFQDLAKSGATFGYSLTELRGAASDARMSLDEFSGFVQNNTQRFAAFGGTVDQGIRNISRLRDVMGDDLTNRFRELGITGEEINEQLSMQLYLNRAGARTRGTTDAQYLASTLALTQNMTQLAKLTGEDVKSQQEKIAQAQMDVAFQRELNSLDEDERKKVNAALAEAMAAGGPAAVEVLKAQFLGMPPLTEAAQLYTATQSEGAELIRQNLDNALNSAIEYDDYMLQRESRMADYGEAYANASERLDTILRAAGAGLDGMPGLIAEQMMQSQTTFGTYIDQTGRFVRDEFISTFQGLSDGGPDDDEDGGLGAMARFQTAIDNARNALQDNLITPLQDRLTPVLNNFTEWFSGFTADETGEGSKFERALQGLTDFITDPLMPAITGFFEAFAADPEQAIADVVEDIGNFFRDAIFGQMVDLDPRDLETDFERQGGLIQSLRNGISALFSHDSVLTSLMNGVTTVTNGLREGFSEFWNSPESGQLREDIKSMFQKIVEEIILMISDNSFLFGGRADEIRESRLREAAQGGEIDDSLVEYRSELVRIQEAVINRSLDFLRTHGYLNSTMQAQLNEALSEIEDFSTVDQMTAYQDQIDQAGRDFVNSQVQILMDKIDRFDNNVNQHKNTQYQGRSGVFGIGAQTPEEQEEARIAELRATREEILSQIEDTGDPEAISRLTEALNNIEPFNNGTKGFEDFGSGTLAMLHGKEAVIPLDSPLGQMISNINTGAAIESRPSMGRMQGIPQTPNNSLPNTSALEPDGAATVALPAPAATDLTEAERQQIENLRLMLSSQEGVVRELQRLNTTNENMQVLQDETREYLRRILRETEQ